MLFLVADIRETKMRKPALPLLGLKTIFLEGYTMKLNRLISMLIILALLGTALSISTPSATAAGIAVANGSRPSPGVVLNEIQGTTDPAVYLIQLQAPALASYRGGIPGLAATNPDAAGQVKLDPNSAASVAYRNHLASLQSQFIATVEQAVGHAVQVLFQYDAALNGMAVRLTPPEAAQVAKLPGVLRVQRDVLLQLHTDNGPAWIGAPGLWNGSNTGGLPGTKGEGIVIGVIDTGINHDHPSFADPGPVDGYNYPTYGLPSGPGYKGVCNPVNGLPFCNDKLIGVYDFTGTSPMDDNGHGSHTASTTGSNLLNANLIAPTITINRQISGVAPHANIIAYKACQTVEEVPDLSGCLTSATVGAINQATLDGVDVINFSIGGTSSDPWADLNAQAFLGARDAGVFVSVSAGNSGPGAATIGSPADAPWLMAVGASTHDRKFINALVNMAGGETTPPADMEGKSVTSGYGPAAIVYAGDYGFPLCGTGPSGPASNPFPAGTFNGEIVVCDRGTYGRVEKGQNVKAGGAGGMVLANDQANGDSVVADTHVLPTVHITYDDGVTLKAWLASGSGHTATIAGTTLPEDPAFGDIMASFSSRGQNPSVPDVLKPDVTAPGVDIFAAWMSPIPPGADPEFNIISGTSMSSPHAAGAAALIRALHPNWTPAEVQSALMTTAFNALAGGGGGAAVHGVLKEDGVTPADPFDIGGGRVDLTRAARAGLVLDESEPNYSDANPGSGGDPRTLNLASLADDNCVGSCSWTRVVESTLNASMTWHAVTSAPIGMALSVSPSSFTLAPGAPQTINVTADVSSLSEGGWHFAQIFLVPDDSSIPDTHLPVAANTTGGGISVRTLHFHGNLHDGCTGNGATDLEPPPIGCDGPFLREDPVLDTNPAAKFGPVTVFLDCTVDRCLADPNWVWNLDGPTTLEGPMTVEWWESCPECNLALFDDFFIRLWADGALKFETRVRHLISVPGVPVRLQDTVLLTQTITATNTIVLQIDGIFINQDQRIVYYDSTQPCPGATGNAPCDSLVRMPVVGPLNQPPVANDDSATVIRGGSVTVDVLSNDNDPDGDSLTITSHTNGSHGTVSNNGNGTLTYTHDGTTGHSSDSFTYTISDGNGGSDTATVAITVTDPPPPQDGDKTTGGGWLEDNTGTKINFGFEVEEDGALEGDLQLNDKNANVKVHITEITALGGVTGDCASIAAGPNALEFHGTGTFNGNGGASFRVCVQDNGEPGRGNDKLYLECLAGCTYNTDGRTPDDVLDGGNLQVQQGANSPAPTSGARTSAPRAATMILNPVLLTEGLVGQAQLFTVTVYDQYQEKLANATVTLTWRASDGSVQTLTAFTDLAGTAVFSTLNLAQVAEYLAASDSAESNAVEVSPLLN